MPTLTPEKDDVRNPGQANWDAKVAQSSSLNQAEQSALADIERNFGTSADPTDENANISALNNRESQPPAPATPVNSTEKGEDTTSSRKTKALNFVKQKGPLGIILSALAGFGFFGIASFGPAIGFVQGMSTFKEDMNDTMTAQDKNQSVLFKKKMKPVTRTKGVCNKVITIKCRFATMSDKQVKKLEDAGFRVRPAAEERKKNMLGRNAVEAIEYDKVSADGRTKEVVTVDARNYDIEMRKSAQFRTMLFKSFNARHTSMTGGAIKKVMEKMKITKARKLSGDKKAMDGQFESAVKEGNGSIGGKTATKNENGDWVDEDGRRIEGEDKIKMLNEEPDSSQLNKLGKKATGGLLTKGMNAVNIAGDVDTYCSVMKMLRLVSAASKVVKYSQYIRLGFIALNTSDSIIAGAATPEAVEYMGEKFSHQDLRKDVLDQSAAMKEGEWTNEAGVYDPQDATPFQQTIANPDEGKNAYDSQMYRASAYGAVEESTFRSTQNAVGIGLGASFLQKLSDKMSSVIGGQKTCSVVQSVYVRGVGLIVGAVAIAFSGGLIRAGLKVGTVAAFGLAAYFAMAYLQSYLKDMAEGELPEDGYDLGQATGSGVGGLLGSTASSKGLAPLSTKEAVADYMTLTAETNNQYDEIARLEARDDPFNAYNKYSFLGSLAGSFYPMLNTATKNGGTMLAMAPNILATAASAISPTAKANTVSPIDRFQKCTDPSFTEINLNFADLNCNPRYGLTTEELNADPEVLADWMIEHKQIVPSTGEPVTTAEAQKSLFRAIGEERISAVLGTKTPDDDQLASVDTATPTGNQTSATLATTPFPPTAEDQIDYPENKDDNGGDILQDTRTYAHWYRFCRYGDGEGRNAHFGDPDGLEKSFLDGLVEEDYQSTGRECIDANACPASENDKPQDGVGLEKAQERCRPAVYKIYRAYTSAFNTNDDMDNPAEEESADTAASGDSRKLAKQILENPNIEFNMAGTKPALTKYAETGQATSFCGGPYELKAELLQVILDNAEKYKIVLNNFGFIEDRIDVPCDNGQHPKGGAIDINGISEISGGKSCDNITFDANCTSVVDSYSRDWLKNLAKRGHKTLGGVGQKGCGNFNLTNNPPSEIDVVAAGNLHFEDACNHLHIDAGDRKGR